MAAAATFSQVFQNRQTDDKSSSNVDVSREEIQAAIAKAVELRALHAALVQGNCYPSNLGYSSSSPPVSRPLSHLSAQDYPIFTPSYEDEALSGYHTNKQTLSESWDKHGLEARNDTETVVSDYKKKIFSPTLAALESHICPAEDQKSVAGSSFPNHITVLQTSPSARSRRNSLGDFKSVSSCNRCKPAVITSESENVVRTVKNSDTVAPLSDSHSSVQSQPRNRGVISRLFPRLKKKQKNENSPNQTESEEIAQVLKDSGMLSIEALKKELIEAHVNRDAALMEVAEMRSSLGELKQKLEHLESYCEDLRKALTQATQTKDSQINERLGDCPRKGKAIDVNEQSLMPVSDEVMAEGFLQIVSEARLSVKQFCKTLIGEIEETDNTLTKNLNSLLRPYKLSMNSKYSKAVSYHLEAIINLSLFQDFENCVFQKNGSQKLLDPQQDRQAQFSSFVALRNLSWNEVLRKGTKYYSEEFSKFCDQKMSLIISTLNWTKPWPEHLLQAFFVASKCIWLLHLLAFSFHPALGILRVEDNTTFDPHYMEDMLMERQRCHGQNRVKIMVMPGFYVKGRVLKCKVICRYKKV
ncbi:UDP-glycosyltransferase 92A1 [Hibiscus syriacus]|uniref:UDP-glycosyltransferase 92A1 n=1 Tax=Hibiscus syriacus TaxID=106335 RepID=A0A6A2WE40_HIBSY|nr:IRK-interacting protein-like [Hibiscus syriacus]KAE8656673.1 UDP-glycosyltransferase 92A1 [Hibiscus syriacus]